MPAPAPQTRLPRAWRAHPRLAVLLGLFLAGSLPLIALHAVPLTAEFAILVVLAVQLGAGRRSRFSWAWTPWLWGVVALDDLRGLQAVGPAAHAGDVAGLERRLLGGGLPVVDLQAHWAAPGLTAHDVGLSILYLMHSPAPLLCGAALWTWRREYFRAYVVSILLAAGVALAVYLAFPEAPPWLAAEHGIIPPVRRITTEVVAHAGPLSGIYSGADPLPNAAMPSLHVGYPLIIAAFSIAAFGRRALWVAVYPAALCVAVVYLGEHWVVDVAAGVIVVGGAMLVAVRLAGPDAEPAAMLRRLGRRWPLLRARPDGHGPAGRPPVP